MFADATVLSGWPHDPYIRAIPAGRTFDSLVSTCERSCLCCRAVIPTYDLWIPCQASQQVSALHFLHDALCQLVAVQLSVPILVESMVATLLHC